MEAEEASTVVRPSFHSFACVRRGAWLAGYSRELSSTAHVQTPRPQ